MFEFLLLLVAVFFNNAKSQETQPTSIQVELVGGRVSSEGRVEVVDVNGRRRGTVCSDGWDDADAAVVCRMKGFNGKSVAVKGSKFFPTRFGPGKGIIFLRSVNCNGNEKTLLDCPLEGWEVSNYCSHNEDAGAVCQEENINPLPPTTTTTPPPTICSTPKTNVKLDRFDGKTLNGYEGVVMYQVNNNWRSICNERWGRTEAAVVCRMLCYNPVNARAIIGSGTFGDLSDISTYAFSNVKCNGDEDDLEQCSKENWTPSSAVLCDVREAAAVSCSSSADAPLPGPEAVVGCNDGGRISVGFSTLSEPNLGTSNIKLVNNDASDISCPYNRSKKNDFVSLYIPLTGCNVITSTNQTSIIYTTQVFYTVPDTPSLITRSNNYLITIFCSVNRSAFNNASYVPKPRQLPPQGGEGAYKVRLALFKDASFKDEIVSSSSSSSSSSINVILSDWIYAGIILENNDRKLKLIMLSSYLSMSPAPLTQPMYYLFNNKCPEDSTLTLYPINDTMMAFKFRSLEFKRASPESTLYLHVDSKICLVEETSSDCSRNCDKNQSRKKRSVSSVITNYLPIKVSKSSQIDLRKDPLQTPRNINSCNKLKTGFLTVVLFLATVLQWFL